MDLVSIVACRSIAPAGPHDPVPSTVEAAGLHQRTEGQHRLTTGDPPAHSGPLETLGDVRAIRGLDDTRIDDQSLRSHVVVTHPVPVPAEMVQYACEFLAWRHTPMRWPHGRPLGSYAEFGIAANMPSFQLCRVLFVTG